MSKNAVDKQIDHMVAFIENEANEKRDEIDAKAEEEFNTEKGRLVQQQRKKIMEFYAKKEKHLELQKKIQMSSLYNNSRLKVLEAQQNGIKEVMEDCKGSLKNYTKDERYAGLLSKLITQGLCQLLETDVVVRCRKQDLQVVVKVLQKGDCLQEYTQLTGREVKLTVDQERFLNPDCSGGVELIANNGRFRVENTLDARLDICSKALLPQLRYMLYGANPDRKFFD